MKQFDTLRQNIGNKKLLPIYFLHGEEPFFIDEICDLIAETVLTEEEKGFNQSILFGKETSISDIISTSRRYPMMADHQVVIVKEAQHLSRNIDEFLAYVDKPQPSTILVIAYKYQKLDKRKKLGKILDQSGYLFESNRLYDNQIPTWITSWLKSQGKSISPKGSMMIADYLGNDLSKLVGELKKLFIVLGDQSKEITPTHIEENIGASKDFNNFELLTAIGLKNQMKVSRILNYFSENPKEHPFVSTTGVLYGYFAKLMKLHGLKGTSDAQMAKTIGVNPYFFNEYKEASGHYPMKKISTILSGLRELDLKSKGVGAQNINDRELFKELLVLVA